MESKGRPQEDLAFDISHKGKLKVLRSNRERDRHRIFQVQETASAGHAATEEEKLCRVKGGSEERTSCCLLGCSFWEQRAISPAAEPTETSTPSSVLRSRSCTRPHWRSFYSKGIPNPLAEMGVVPWLFGFNRHVSGAFLLQSSG